MVSRLETNGNNSLETNRYLTFLAYTSRSTIRTSHSTKSSYSYREIKSRNDDLTLRKRKKKKKKFINFDQILQLPFCLSPRNVQCFDKILFKDEKVMTWRCLKLCKFTRIVCSWKLANRNFDLLHYRGKFFWKFPRFFNDNITSIVHCNKCTYVNALLTRFLNRCISTNKLINYPE